MINAFNTLQQMHYMTKKLGKTKTMSFISKYNWMGINYPHEKMTGKSLRKIIQQLLLICVKR